MHCTCEHTRHDFPCQDRFPPFLKDCYNLNRCVEHRGISGFDPRPESGKAGEKRMAERRETPFLVFVVGERRFALSAEEVERVLAAVEITPLPDAPSFLRGVINCGGKLVPVIDLRVRFGLPAKRTAPSDRFVFVRRRGAFAREEGALFAFLVEEVEGVFPLATEIISLQDFPEELFKGAIVGLENGDERVVCIQTAETLFSMTDAEIRNVECLCAAEEGALS